MTGRLPWAGTAVTLLGLGFGVAAVGAALGGRLAGGFVLLIAAGLCDLLDGWVERRLGRGGTPFGVQLDSLVDMASFGLVPMILVLEATGPSGAGVAPWNLAAAWIYASCAALRLASFSVRAAEEPAPASHYRGLPVTYSALVFPVLFAVSRSLPAGAIDVVMLVGTLGTAALFVLPVPIRKPAGLAYPLFFVLAAAVSAWLLLGAGAAGRR